MREKQIKKIPLSRKFEVSSHFVGFPTANSAFFSRFNFQTLLTGTGAGIESPPSTAENPGIIRLLTGTAGGSSRSGIRTASSVVTGGADIEIEALYRVTQVAAKAEDYEYWVLAGDNSGGVPTNGAYIYFDWSVSTNIQCICKNAGQATTVISRTPETTQWTKVNLKIPASATSATFTFNDSDIVTITSNIPQSFGIQAVMSKFAGVVNQGFDLDYLRVGFSLP